MQFCEIPIIIAYIATVYIFASIYYLIVTRTYGTPFNDAVNKLPNLKQIKNESAVKRKKAFLTGIVGAILLLAFLRPYKMCA